MPAIPYPELMHDHPLHGGEGYGFLPWESMEANFNAEDLSHLLEAKVHGPPPTMGYGPLKNPASMSQMTAIQKRSFKRAYARALRDGAAWYRGNYMTPQDFPSHMPRPMHPSPNRCANVPTKQYTPPPIKQRLNVIQYNVGGLSTHKLEEVKQWGLHIQADVIVLTETRWSFSSEWSDGVWHALHSGTPTDRADGILILFRASSIMESQIGSVALLPGRLIHVRIHYRQRACDFLCCYNFMDDRSTARLNQRHQFWNELDACISQIPNRNSILIAGDMNCSVGMDPPSVGTSFFTWQDHHCQGPQHRDMTTFQQIIRKHHLTILNGWNASSGPTFHNGLTASRIDFFLTRTSDADGVALDVKYLTQAEIVPLTGPRHVPLLCSIKKFHFSYKDSHSFSGYTYFQRQQCRLDWRNDAATWHQMLTDTGHAFYAMCDTSMQDADAIQSFHDTLSPWFLRSYPLRSKPKNRTQDDNAGLIQQKWYYHRQVLANKSLTLRALFHVWRCQSKYASLHREHKRSTKQLKKQRFFDLVASVQVAANKHDSFEVHQVISKYTPKQPKKKIQLRNADGSPASPDEAMKLTTDFVAEIWHGPAQVDLGHRDPPGVPFTVQELEHELSQLPHNKSVAKPFIPALVLKMHSAIIAPWLHAHLTQWWSTTSPYIPSLWKRAWVTLIPKPHKSPSKVSNLRCIALQEPLGKCVLGALTKKLQQAVGPALKTHPQFAFLPNRSTGDAIRRVAAHCDEVRCLIKTQRRSAQQRAAHVAFFQCCGGLQIFLDIQRAFDQLPRQQLFDHLDTLHDLPEITTLMAQWHSDTDYCVEQSGRTELVSTGCGVCQGCRAAPLLWNCFLDQLFQKLSNKINPEWVTKTLTAFADDIHQGSIFRSKHQLMTELTRLGYLLDALEDMGLKLSLEKSHILIDIAGTHGRKIRSQLLKRDGTHTYIEIPRANGSYSCIPVKKTAEYLGTCMSYANFEHLTFEKRVRCARITFHRLRRWLHTPHIALTHRLQLWRASVLTTLMYGLLAVNITMPILKRFQQVVFGMYRQLTRNHSYRTRESHQMILHRYHLEHPLHVLTRHVQQLQSLIGQRTQFLQPDDIVLAVDWSTLQQNLQLIHVALEVQATPHPTADSQLEVPDPLQYACPSCPHVASSLPNLRRHQTTVHGCTQFRTSLGHAMSCSVGGLPQCTFCYQTFSTWRQFQIHLDRQCCQARPCDPRVNLDALLREEEEQRVLRLHQGLTELLQTKPYGADLLQIVRDRNWNRLMDLRLACEALAAQCCICDFHFNRPQELHNHLRVHHPQWTPHTFTKASQLCRGFALNSPCRYCSKSFRQAHSCPILTQVAMLLLHMPTDAGPVASPPPEALRCEVCGFRTHSIHDIHRHLADTHRLAFHDWQPERDLMGKDPACSHCSKCFTDVSAVRQHVTLGQCPMFDPNRSPFLLPIAPMWNQLLQSGDFQPALQDAMCRLRMTLHCAQCGAAYTRSNDLMLHLQTAHSVMWNKAQALTKYLLKILLPMHSCVCNPSLNKVTLTHVCPFYRQIAMLATRSTVEVFLPWPTDRGQLDTLLQHSVSHAICAPLKEAVHARQVRLILSDPGLQAFLREHCVLCGGVFHPALLRDHILQVHASNLEEITDLLPFLYDEYTNAAHTDYQCAQCNQIFNLPLLGDPPLAEQHARQTLALAHYQQCPVIHQLCLLLQHGRVRQRAIEWAGNPGAAGDFWSPGTTPQEGQQGPKRRRKGSKEGQDPAQGSGNRSDPGPTAGGATDGQASHQTGHGQQPDEKARLLRLLHANGAGVCHPCPDSQSQELASRDGSAGGADENSRMETPEGNDDADLGADPSSTAEAPLRVHTDGCPLPDGGASQCPEHQGGVLFPTMGCHQQNPDPDRSGSNSHGQDETLCGPICGDNLRRGQHPEIPQPSHLGDHQMTPWLLQISLRCDELQTLLETLAGCKVWNLLGASLKMHTMHHSHQAQQLQNLLGKGKSAGKGKAKR